MTRRDKTIACKDCGKNFIFRGEEQDFFAEKGYDEPIRCKDCRSARKNSSGPANSYGTSNSRGPSNGRGPVNNRGPREGGSGGRFAERELFPAICASCGKKTQVPFKPREGGKPVYCNDCFSKQR